MQGIGVPLLKPGDKAGRYELLLQIAQGGMGAVWVARLKLENGFEKLFAVKTLLTHLADQAVFRQMFLDEARIAASIEHPNVGQILDMGEQEDLLYLVMEWVEGESVNALARSAASANGKIPYGVALRMVADACSGLHAVHEHRDREGKPLEIVHRDVSPHNMLVSSRGVTKVIDFGVAKARDRLTGATQTGAVKGKLRYMAPEQACGGKIDRRVDVWGAGAVLYTLVAGRYPYGGETDVDVLRTMMAGKPPAPLPPNVPAPIERVIKRALSVDPEGRYATAAELQEDIEVAARELGVITTQQGVAQYVEQNAGTRLAKLRTAIHSAIADREAHTSSVRRSITDVENTISSSTIIDEHPPTQTDSHSGTLMGTTAQDRMAGLAMRSWSLPKSFAVMGGVALVGVIILLLARATTSDRNSIPSASAAPASGDIAPAQATKPAEPPGIDLDSVPPPIPAPAPAAPAKQPPPKSPEPAPARTIDLEPAPKPARVETSDHVREPSRTKQNSSSTSSTSGAQNTSSSSGSKSGTATPPVKKRPLDTAIDTRR